MNNNNQKSVFVTGANGGLGMETCKLLVQRGFSHLTMACRTDEKAQQAKKEVEVATGGGQGVKVPGGFPRSLKNQALAHHNCCVNM